MRMHRRLKTPRASSPNGDAFVFPIRSLLYVIYAA